MTIYRVFFTLSIIRGNEIATSPKTEGSVRTVPLPEKLCGIIRDYESDLYELHPDDRLFPFTKKYFYAALRKGCKAAGMDLIRIHDFRHSHAALMISMGVPTLLISQRLGHDDVKTTLNIYGHHRD